ncbi:MAG TPA: sterol desaturase family protein [Phenylobacterium sp.]|nr:sterol desaturase family protein [Phenylobacterium sp.]
MRLPVTKRDHEELSDPGKRAVSSSPAGIGSGGGTNPRGRRASAPKRKWLAEMKRRHMAHHFHDETGNFGITSFLWDRAFGTFYDKASDRPAKSPTVFNLGYTPEVAEVYPHVARLSGGVATDHPRERVRQKAGAGN